MKSHGGRRYRAKHGGNQAQDADWSMSVASGRYNRRHSLATPLKSKIQYRCVCRTWRNLLSDSYLSEFQRERAQSMLVLRSPPSCVSRKAAALAPNDFYVVDLESGLLRTARRKNREGKRYWDVVFGFGFSPESNHYMVLRITRKKLTYPTSILRSEGEICIFGDSEWKSIGEIPFPDYIDSKKIRPMSPPNGFRRDTTEMTLGVLRDCLFICDSMTLYNLDIWVMKEYGVKDSWTKEIVIAKTSLPSNLQNSFLQPIMVSKDGEVLISSDSNVFVWYDPGSKSFRKVTLPSRVGSEVEAVCSVASFDSLSAIMKKECRRDQCSTAISDQKIMKTLLFIKQNLIHASESVFFAVSTVFV
ncbi:F-box/kelch-repeat protein At3g23880-like [Populus alba]|uniref:F-box/kelch-repeat protein At3g23880-like n=1 Tax=Populus alba TaxID=43335 RepID=UPI003CC781F0